MMIHDGGPAHAVGESGPPPADPPGPGPTVGELSQALDRLELEVARLRWAGRGHVTPGEIRLLEGLALEALGLAVWLQAPPPELLSSVTGILAGLESLA